MNLKQEPQSKQADEKEYAETRKVNIIRFLGGKSTLFVLVSILLIGLIIVVFTEVSFIFYPIKVFSSTVILPIILASIGYYLLRPILRLLEKIHIPRVWGILIIFLGVGGLITLLVFLVLPFLKGQFNKLIEDFPTYFRQLTIDIDAFLRTSIFSSYYEELNINVLSILESTPDNVGKFLNRHGRRDCCRV